MVKIESFLLLGMGSIMKALLELLNHEHHKFLTMPMTCICPEDIPEYIFKIKPDLKHVKTHITEENVVKLLSTLINPSVFVIDLTVNVETIDIIKLCKEKGVMYMNTSLEKYNKDESNMDPEHTTLYYQELELEKALKDFHNPVTIAHSMGMNPGAISSLVYQGIEAYCKTYAHDKLGLLKENKFNIVAKDILDMIHVSEFDNQIVKQKAKPNMMINSWSGEGFIAEALCTSFVASNLPMLGYEKSKYNECIYFSPIYRSMDSVTDSVCLYPDGTPFKYNGRMITHFEVVSLSKYLSEGDYTPRISYVYSSSPVSQECLDIVKASGYKEPSEYYVFMQDDIINKNSFDSLGACLFFRDGCKFWCGTVLTNEHVMKLLGKDIHMNATQLQVCAPVLTAIEWMLENPERGVITVEEIPYKYILQRCIPYWGNFYCREIIQPTSTYNPKFAKSKTSKNIHIDNAI
jgi:homospermidine synthase